MAAVVDTNVTVVANHKSNEPLSCAAACAKALYEITRKGLLVIDEGGLIFSEYKKYLSFAGQPGAGDYFFKWLSDNRYRPNRVAQVTLVDDLARPGEFEAFPEDAELDGFDYSDRKFVAVALTHSEYPPVFNATDRDWWDYRDALERHLTIRFVCGVDRFQG